MQSSVVNKITYAVVPLVALVIGPGLHDANGVPKLIALVVGGFIYVALNLNKLFLSSRIQIIPWLMILSYGIIQLIRLDDFQHFLLGAFIRNGGYIALITLALIFTITVNLPRESIDSFYKIFLFTSYGLLIYGVLQFLDLLPYKVSNQYQNAIELTLTNPNFASAYLGTFLSVFVIYNLTLKRNKLDIKNIFIGLAASFLLYKTQSLQGYLIIFSSTFLFLILHRKQIEKYLFRYKKLSLGSIMLLVSITLVNFNFLINWIINNGSVNQRINYWKLSADIWQDNKLTGVGLDNLRNYTTRYRDLNMVKQEGIFTAPDRSHNVVLDHFVNGGIFTGALWLLFIVTISYLALRNLIYHNKVVVLDNYLLVIIIWFSYVVQSLISVDHLALTVLGYISGGLIVANNRKQPTKLLSKIGKNRFLIRINLVFLTALFLIFSSYSFKVVKYEDYAYKYLYKNDATVLQEFYDSEAVVSQTLEDVAVKISQSKDFKGANLFALKLLEYRPSSHQAYYIKSVYRESQNDISAAKDEMLKALAIDKYNSVYLLGMSIYEYKLGNQPEAERYLSETIAINPNQQGVDIVSKLISSTK
jgi:O-antigen ligase